MQGRRIKYEGKVSKIGAVNGNHDKKLESIACVLLGLLESSMSNEFEVKNPRRYLILIGDII